MSLGLHVSPLCSAIPVESGTTPAELVPLLWNLVPLLWTPQESCDSYRNGGGTEKY